MSQEETSFEDEEGGEDEEYELHSDAEFNAVNDDPSLKPAKPQRSIEELLNSVQDVLYKTNQPDELADRLIAHLIKIKKKQDKTSVNVLAL